MGALPAMDAAQLLMKGYTTSSFKSEYVSRSLADRSSMEQHRAACQQTGDDGFHLCQQRYKAIWTNESLLATAEQTQLRR